MATAPSPELFEPPDGWLDLQAARVVQRVKTWVLAAGGAVTLGATLLGFNFNEQLNRHNAAMDAAQTRAATQLSDIQKEFKQLVDLRAKLEAAVNDAKGSLEGVNSRVSEYDQELHRNLQAQGRHEERLANAESIARGAAAQSRTAADKSAEAFAKAESSLSQDERLAMDWRASQTGLAQEYGAIKAGVEELRYERANSGAYVVFEKRDGQRIEDMDVEVSLGRISRRGSDERIMQLEVFNRHKQRIWGPGDVRRGEVVTFASGDYEYTMVPTYTLQFWGQDAAGLAVRRRARQKDRLPIGTAP